MVGSLLSNQLRYEALRSEQETATSDTDANTNTENIRSHLIRTCNIPDNTIPDDHAGASAAADEGGFDSPSESAGREKAARSPSAPGSGGRGKKKQRAAFGVRLRLIRLVSVRWSQHAALASSRQHKRAITTAGDHDIMYHNHNKNIPCGL